MEARYDPTGTTITFRIFSSRATRIDPYLYRTALGSQKAAVIPLAKDSATNVWSASVPVSTLQGQYGITGPVYYAYRAWGPNWPYDPAG